jgi:hypothetical protein
MFIAIRMTSPIRDGFGDDTPFERERERVRVGKHETKGREGRREEV